VALPPGLTNLNWLDISGNALTNLTLSAGLGSLTNLYIENNQLVSVTLPSELRNLTRLDVWNNGLTRIALPAGIPLLVPSLADLRNRGVQVTLFPVIRSPQRTVGGDFSFELFADTGTFNVFRSTDLTNWVAAGSITVSTPNYPGTTFTDTGGQSLGEAFYQIRP
jgi:Leucine-rich repeat (LRR) protein